MSTSLPLLRQTLHNRQIDIALLQEVWHPADGTFHIRNYSEPLTKLRQGREGGGVAIVTHEKVKAVHLQEYDVDGLEAVWADVMVENKRMVVGSIYIAPGDTSALDLLDVVISKILQSHRRILLAMYANSRNSLWDDMCIGIPHSRKSLQMGFRLEEIIMKHGLQIHNDGSATFRSGNNITAPDVTLSKDISDYGIVSWCVTDDDLRSPHECLVISIGDRVPVARMTVIDWPKFDWDKYVQVTKECLTSMHGKWLLQNECKLEDMVSDLCTGIRECVDKVASTRTITRFSKPWISRDIAEELNAMRKLKRKCRYHRSQANVREFNKARDKVVSLINKAEQEWWLNECEKLATMNERQKWKAINKLTNQHVSNKVQPIRKMDKGKICYMFDDKDIMFEMENHHIRKTSLNGGGGYSDITQDTKDLEEAARDGSANELMNGSISDTEIELLVQMGSQRRLMIKQIESVCTTASSLYLMRHGSEDVLLMNGRWKIVWYCVNQARMITMNAVHIGRYPSHHALGKGSS